MPAGAECTGLQVVDNLNGFAYVMSGFQHAGDCSYNPTTGTGTLNGKTVPAELMSAISNWLATACSRSPSKGWKKRCAC